MAQSGKPVYKRSPSIVIYGDDPVSPTFFRAEDNTNRSRSIGVSADPASATATQTLITAVMARLTAIGGGKLLIGPGTYLAEFALPTGTELAGESNRTIIKLPNASDNMNCISIGGISNIYIHDIALNGNRLNQTSPGGAHDSHWNGIYAYGAGSNVLIERVHSYSNGYHGIISGGGASKFRIKDCVFNDNGFRPVHAHNVFSHSWIEGNDCYANGQGFAADPVPGYDGIFFFDGITDVTIARNKVVTTSIVGIGFGGSYNGSAASTGGVISENNITGPGAGSNQGIWLWGNNLTDVLVDNNIIAACDVGVYLDAGYVTGNSNLVVSKNIIHGGGGGITFAATTSNCKIISNQITPSTNMGIHVVGFNFGNIDGNYCYMPGVNEGIKLVTSSYNSVSKNIIYRGKGIAEATSACDYNIYEGNIFYGYSVIDWLKVLGPHSICRGNLGSVGTGEIATLAGSIATLTENAFNSLDNPFGKAVRLLTLDIYVSTGATATAPNIDCGIGSGATTDYTTLFDDLPGETIGFYRSTIATPGTQTVPQLWESGSGNRYLNMSIKDAAATGMVATYVATVMGL
ncbi:MAG: right-handed parallel beta-helix repeat-containing protein [Syntrophorhabdaceae bacterium]|nr:right-handed parallel beta-helix repeat-containing protein [Syntrophorhabdaceae bacterium]